MKKVHLLFGFALCLFAGCGGSGTGSGSCGDPALVAIPSADSSAPQLTWYVTQASETPSGPVSGITPYTGSEVNISVAPTDEVKVYLVARDEQSGVAQVSMTGTFGQTCSTPSGPIAASGMLPEESQDLSFLTVCGMIEWKLDEIPVNVGMSCGPGNTLTELNFVLTGSADNNTGTMAESTLTITVTP